MKKQSMIILGIAMAVLIALGAYLYVFSVYEVDVTISSRVLYADQESVTVIECRPVNGLGFTVPFRKVEAKLAITEGQGLVTVIESDTSTGRFVIQAKDLKGKVVLRVSGKFMLFPSVFEVEILPNAA